VVARCPELNEARGRLRSALALHPLVSPGDVDHGLDSAREAALIARWLLWSGRLPLYSKAVAWAKGEGVQSAKRKKAEVTLRWRSRGHGIMVTTSEVLAAPLERSA
jgi:hypothetical protein